VLPLLSDYNFVAKMEFNYFVTSTSTSLQYNPTSLENLCLQNEDLIWLYKTQGETQVLFNQVCNRSTLLYNSFYIESRL